jgi:hypothetical protein
MPVQERRRGERRQGERRQGDRRGPGRNRIDPGGWTQPAGGSLTQGLLEALERERELAADPDGKKPSQSAMLRELVHEALAVRRKARER